MILGWKTTRRASFLRWISRRLLTMSIGTFLWMWCPRWDLGIDGLIGWNGATLRLPSRSSSMGALQASFVALEDWDRATLFPPIFSFLPWKLLANCCQVQEMGALFLASKREEEEEEERGWSCPISCLPMTPWFSVMPMQINYNILTRPSCGLRRFQD